MQNTRLPSPTDFPVDVPGVGKFIFASRRMRDEIQIQVEFAKLVDGATPTDWLRTVCGWISVLRTLTVSCPPDWDIDDMDPGDDSSYARLGRVHEALVTKEADFRLRQKAVGQAGSEGQAAVGPVVVSPPVQPAGD